MTYKTHIAFAEAVALPPALLLHAQGQISLFDLQNFAATVALAALLPDLDHMNSYISKRVPLLSFVVTLFTKHRGFTHSIKGIIALEFLAILAYLIKLLPLPFTLGTAVGYPLHILGDAMSMNGIKSFCCHKRLIILPKSLRFATGSLKEKLYFLLFFAIIFLEIWFIDPLLL